MVRGSLGFLYHIPLAPQPSYNGAVAPQGWHRHHVDDGSHGGSASRARGFPRKWSAPEAEFEQWCGCASSMVVVQSGHGKIIRTYGILIIYIPFIWLVRWNWNILKHIFWIFHDLQCSSLFSGKRSCYLSMVLESSTPKWMAWYINSQRRNIVVPNLYMEVSTNGGTLTSMVYHGTFLLKRWFGGTPRLRKPPCIYIYIRVYIYYWQLGLLNPIPMFMFKITRLLGRYWLQT